MDNVIDIRNSSYPESMIFFLKPYESITIKVPNQILSIFSDWRKEDGLSLKVETVNNKSKVTEYGTFEPSSRLLACYFIYREYTLYFSNDGREEAKFAIIFSDKNLSGIQLIDKFSANFQFPFFNRSSMDLENFMFIDAGNGGGYVLIISCIFLIACLIVFLMVFCSGMCCFCCGKSPPPY